MDSPKKQPNKWLHLIHIPFQMGLVIFVFSYLGELVDAYYKNKSQINFKIATLIGVFIAIYLVISQVNQINKK
ncbi:AtpZ/AtpI family protein [Flavobacterium cucumis]|uniref:Putative F0F1-ATPase subunit Ca2+/Mg2+ transporter n=1 Tax=Flavobacterium cucumis TaxID=416016 RepID=A0A1M7ZU70_9FLAO|nr:AtpZ/AtpI family protein [Flavobacterium cucumis]SHO72330.1 Putative F0F1-ATPase subunit Ca2+/Mg2+ transporter [Flavobacterium cucumis]